MENVRISEDIKVNAEYIKKNFHYQNNIGYVFREFQIKMGSKQVDAFLTYFDGLSSQTLINRDMMYSLINIGIDEDSSLSVEDAVFKRIVPLAPLVKETDMQKALYSVNFGECALFVDGCSCAFLADVKGWASRGVDSPINEVSLSGPQEAFSESIMTNLALVRKILKDSRLVAEPLKVGSVSETPVALMYLDGVTNPKIVDEVRRRISGIDVEYIFSSSDVEMFIEKNTFFPVSHTLKTERPDRAASMLAEGKVVVIVQGSPFVLVLPTTAGDLIEATEDNYVRVPEANMMRVVRLFGMALSLLLPGCFVAVMLYHHEVIPTDLLLAIEASRERVPFSLVFELILIELSFELIKEASVRVPNPIGSSLGIIGGLILGQAAVDARIVSPILIIIVAISGLGTFTTPTVALSRSLALLRFGYIIAGALCGFLGIVTLGIIHLSVMASSNVYSVPFLSPLINKESKSGSGSVFVNPIWKKELRPKALHPLKRRMQPPVSRKWTEEDK